MNSRSAIFFTLLLAAAPAGLVFGADATNTPGAAAATANRGPEITFDSTTYNYGKVMSGETIEHDFIFTNTGDSVLVVTGVHPACGCTTAGTWTPEVKPGETGKIPLQFSSSHFSGPTVKTANVTSNDKKHPAVQLALSGTIWHPIEINPQTPILNAIADSGIAATTTVQIVSSLQEPITVSQPRCNNPAFKVQLETIRPGKQFQLTVHTVPPLKQGTVQGTITMTTDSTNAPTINITAFAFVQPPMVVMPPQIMLPAGPVRGAANYMVSIRNNASAPINLSDPKINVDGATVEIKEVGPGHQFTLVVKFPDGFQLAPDKTAEVTVNTTSPDVPLIKVPIRQSHPAPQQAYRPQQPLRTMSAPVAVPEKVTRAIRRP